VVATFPTTTEAEERQYWKTVAFRKKLNDRPNKPGSSGFASPSGGSWNHQASLLFSCLTQHMIHVFDAVGDFST
jgi:hypothetical protein